MWYTVTKTNNLQEHSHVLQKLRKTNRRHRRRLPILRHFHRPGSRRGTPAAKLRPISNPICALPAKIPYGRRPASNLPRRTRYRPLLSRRRGNRHRATLNRRRLRHLVTHRRHHDLNRLGHGRRKRDPPQRLMAFETVCPVLVLTHFPCPTCGITRAYLALLGGDFVRALYFHPLFWLVPFGIAAVAWHLKRRSKLSLWLMLSVCVAFVACWLVRMIFFGWRGV